MKKYLTVFVIAVLFFTACKKCSNNTCMYDACDSRRKTILIISNDTGRMVYYNDLRKWAVSIHVKESYDSVHTCIICPNIPDSFKTIGKVVVLSGELKESCNNPSPTFYGQGVFYITPTKFK